MRFTLFVTASPVNNLAHRRALLFAKAAKRAKHEISLVFFQGEAVQAGNQHSKPVRGKESVASQWASLEGSDTRLGLCSASAAQRGLAQAGAMHPAFEFASLAQLADSAHCSDRTVSFHG